MRIEGAGQLVQVRRVGSVEVMYQKQELAPEEVYRQGKNNQRPIHGQPLKQNSESPYKVSTKKFQGRLKST